MPVLQELLNAEVEIINNEIRLHNVQNMPNLHLRMIKGICHNVIGCVEDEFIRRYNEK